ncbi:MAG: hypothetical protein ABR576_10205 [Thermoanaerobaculia bacterium]
MSSPAKRLSSLAAAVVLAAAAPLAGQAADTQTAPDRVSVLGRKDPRLIESVGAAVRLARQKLETPGCREVFSDFRDPSGRTLAENLEQTGRTAEDHLRWLIFYNASNEGVCAHREVVFATKPESRFIHVCPNQFLEESRDLDHAAALIIHEELHSLGLGENPPTSREITRQVMARCGEEVRPRSRRE